MSPTRRIVLLAFCLAGIEPVALAAEMPALLKEALKNSEADMNEWARTETTDSQKIRKKEERTVVRFDPSKPYAEQFTPILVKGVPPTASDLETYRKMGEDRASGLNGAEGKGSPSIVQDEESRLRKVLDLDRLTIAEENPYIVIFKIPVARRGLTSLFGSESKHYLVRIDKREKTVLEIKYVWRGSWPPPANGALPSFDLYGLSRLIPKNPPLPYFYSKFESEAVWENTSYSDYVHVTPFDNRLGAESAPLKLLGL